MLIRNCACYHYFNVCCPFSLFPIHKTGLMSMASSVVLSVSLSFILTILYIGSLGSFYFLVLYGLNLSLGVFYLSKNNAMAYSHFLINILLTQIKYFVIS
jgi:hypothetical protein